MHYGSLDKKVAHYMHKLKTLFFSNKQKFLTRSTLRAYSSTKPIKSRPIPRLKIIDEMVELANQHKLPSLSDIAFIGAQHKLETTASLFEAIIKLGAKPENMFFTGKCYSTSMQAEEAIKGLGVRVFADPKPERPGEYTEACCKVVNYMWEIFNAHLENNLNIKKIIILDDGGRFLETLRFRTMFYYPTVVIEQTRGGLYSKAMIDNELIPIITVAQSATKKHIEPQLIATTMLEKLTKFTQDLDITNGFCGVIGNGCIGSAIANYLASKGHIVLIYDQSFINKTNERIVKANGIMEIFEKCSFIFGCTGQDITAGLKLQDVINKDQVWISGSSEDQEFKNFLLANKNSYYFQSNIHGNVICNLKDGKKITIKQWGFPFNFDGTSNSDPTDDFELTRCCLLGGVIQAALTEAIVMNKNHESYSMQMLNPYIQSFIATSWGDREIANQNRYSKELFNKFKDISWIKKCSNGEYVSSDKIKDVFLTVCKMQMNSPALTA